MIIFAALYGKTDGGSVDESELLIRIQNREPEALEQLYDLYKSHLFGLILSIVKKRKVAEQILQQVFLNIWQQAETFDAERDNVFNRLVTFSRSGAINYNRSSAPDQDNENAAALRETFSSIEGGYPDPFEATIDNDRKELVHRALSGLPEKQLDILKSAYYRGMTQEEIANSLNIPVEEVKKSMLEGIQSLEQTLKQFISGND